MIRTRTGSSVQLERSFERTEFDYQNDLHKPFVAHADFGLFLQPR